MGQSPFLQEKRSGTSLKCRSDRGNSRAGPLSNSKYETGGSKFAFFSKKSQIFTAEDTEDTETGEV